MTDITARLIRLLPKRLCHRVGYKILRSVSSEVRAYSDLFVEPYNGWIDWKSGLGECIHALYGIARTLRPKVIVEIGSARGRSTCTLALACKQNRRGKVYAIDPHSMNSWTEYETNGYTLEFLQGRIKRYELDLWCEMVKATSVEAQKEWNKPIDLMFIDGDHTYEGVKRDFELFVPYLTKNAMVIFHDSLWEYLKVDCRFGEHYRKDMGVPAFMNELKERGYHSITLPCFPGLTIMNPLVGGLDFMPAPEEASWLQIEF